MRFYLIFCFLYLAANSNAQKRPLYNDGPYIAVIADTLISHWIDNGLYKTERVSFQSQYIFRHDSLPIVKIISLHSPDEPFIRYDSIKRFVAISDIHGQHNLFINLLKAHKVIDEQEQWVYGDGHLVVVGDIMDRGDGVTESLWFLYALEQQAEKAGGHVHTLLGNHELMVMHGDLGYIHPKYRYTSGISQTSYSNFFSNSTILGRWLRSKNIVAVINDIGFVHGGFSKKVIDQENSLKKINDVFKYDILPQRINVDSQNYHSLLYFENGPLWYRGYADPQAFDQKTANTLLRQLQLQRIVVGHTSMPNITSVHDGKIILIDSSIKFGKTGEVLVFQNDSLFRALLSGNKRYLSLVEVSSDIGLFSYFNEHADTTLGFIIDTDLGLLTGKNRLAENYQPAKLIVRENDKISHKWNIQLRSRGNARKQVCHLPPLKLKLDASTLVAAGFEPYNKLKLVLPCGSAFDQQAVLKEYVIYKLYELIDKYSIQTRLLNIELLDEGKEKYNVKGFIIETEKQYARRTGVNIITAGNVRDASLERDSYLKMVFFQYMILNTDFGIKNKHNLEIISIPGQLRTRAIPYDFDCSGMVNQSYAVPFHSFPIENVRQRLFRGKSIKTQEIAALQVYYNEIRPEFELTINQAHYLSSSSKKLVLKDIDEFYKILNNTKKWKANFKHTDH